MRLENKVLREFISLLEMVFGTVLNAAAFGMIILPQGFAAGGVTGFSRVLSWVLPIPLSAIVMILNLVLLAAAWAFVGRQFMAKTVVVSLLFPPLLEIFSRFLLTGLADDPMVSALTAGLMLGAGTGLVLRSGASCGGFDIVAVIMNKKYHLPVARVMNACDTMVILLQAVQQPLRKTVYGVLIIALVTYCVNRFMTLGTGQTQVLVFSKYHQEIRKILLEKLDVGVTLLKAESGYLREDTMVLISVMPDRKAAEMKRLIMEIDPEAFVVVDQIHSVLGQGYTVDRNYETVASAK